MKLCIITHVIHGKSNNHYFGYGPYIREMNIWLKHVDEVIIVAPLKKTKVTAIDLSYNHDKIIFRRVPDFNLTTFKNIIKTILSIPILITRIYEAMKRADHIHLRCPGNMGLLGCIIQTLFPKKHKTAKYAGNWDPNSKQPWSYRLQQWILNNTLLTKNMQVLVYGEWPNTSINIKPFFTATYTNGQANTSLSLPIKKLPESDEPIQFMFVGTLSQGKRPLYALHLFKRLTEKFPNLQLHFFGEGTEREKLEGFITENNLNHRVVLHGNQTKEVVELAYQNAHFQILASKSEGWPKVVAEAMFWGTVPLATPVSCVGQMMGHGERGILLEAEINKDVEKISTLIETPEMYNKMSNRAKLWSTEFTVDKFEAEIKKLLKV